MNRWLHAWPFHKLETFIRYKAVVGSVQLLTVEAWDNSKRCSCCGEEGSRQGCRFRCLNDACPLRQDHADRDASVNTAWRGVMKLDGTPLGELGSFDERAAAVDGDVVGRDYRTRNTQPQYGWCTCVGRGE